MAFQLPRYRTSATLVSISTVTFPCKRTFSERLRAVSLLSASYVRSVVPTATFQTLTVALVDQRLDHGNSTLVGIPSYLMRRLQSALKAAARLIFHLRCSDNITDALVSLHRLRVPERIQFKIAVLTYRVFHGNAPRYLGPLTSTIDVPGRRALRSAGTDRLVVPPVIFNTVGSRAFPVAAAHTWNSLPEHTVSASTLQSCKRHLKTFLLQQSFRLAL